MLDVMAMALPEVSSPHQGCRVRTINSIHTLWVLQPLKSSKDKNPCHRTRDLLNANEMPRPCGYRASISGDSWHSKRQTSLQAQKNHVKDDFGDFPLATALNSGTWHPGS